MSNSQPELLNNRYISEKKIGGGAFGIVYLANDTLTSQKVAIKQISKTLLESSDYLFQAFFKEIQIMEICNCKNSVKIFEYFEDKENYNIVMELCDLDLELILKQREKGFNVLEIREILEQLNVVLKKMNEERIIHRDLKLKNILVKYNNESDDILGFTIKLSDFGFSKKMEEDITQTKLGTPATMAPEILMGKKYNNKCDLWSLGVIIYQLIYKKLPFFGRTEKELLNVILMSKGVIFPEKLEDKNLENLIESLLTVDPSQRIDFKEYFEHEFFKDKNKNNEKIKNDDKKNDDNNEKNITNNNNINNLDEEFEDLEYDIINSSQFIHKKIINNDINGYTLYKAYDKKRNKYITIKEISRSIIDNNNTNKSIYLKEINLLKLCKGKKNFIELIDVYENEKFYYLIFEDFSGKILEHFINNEKNISDVAINNIIIEIKNILKVINDENIIFEILTTYNFIFKYYNNENDFCIKIMDFGLIVCFLSENEIKNYFLNECKKGNSNVNNNILNFGIIFYKMLFNENLYKNYDEKNNDNYKIIKINKTISNIFKKFIVKTCNILIDKRFKNWNEVINFIEENFNNNNNNNNNNNSNNEKKIDDIIIENLIENKLNKILFVINYYKDKIFKPEFEQENKKFYSEIFVFFLFINLEIKMLFNFFNNNNNANNKNEIHFFRNTNNDLYDYSYINFVSDKITYNKENQIFFIYKQTLFKHQFQIKNYINYLSKKINFNIESFDDLIYKNNKNINKLHSQNIENFFMNFFELFLNFYNKNMVNEAENELKMCKIVLEYNIFLTAILGHKKETIFFNSILNDIKISINYNNNNKKKIFYTFIGGAIKLFKNNKIIEENTISENDLKDDCESYINFYANINKLENEIKNKK